MRATLRQYGSVPSPFCCSPLARHRYTGPASRFGCDPLISVKNSGDPMISIGFRLLASASASLFVFAPMQAFAHGYAGPRFFPTTLAIDDPAAVDELSLPTVARLDGELSFAGEISKRIFPFFAISLEDELVIERDEGVRNTGFQNLAIGAKWQVFTSARREAIVSIGLEADIGGTGKARIGAEPGSALTPTLYFGKGFGDLPLGVLRAAALTGSIGYEFSTRRIDPEGEAIPEAIQAGLTFQYNLGYLASEVQDWRGSGWLRRFIPLVEARFSEPTRQAGEARFEAALQPGLIYVGKRFQLGAEAIVPLTGESQRPGFAVQAHFFLDDLLSRSFGRPIFGGAK